MNRSELDSGMTIEKRDGSRSRLIKIGVRLIHINTKIWGSLRGSYLADLTSALVPSVDIVKVYGPPGNQELLDPTAVGNLLWERASHPKVPKHYRLMKEGETITKWCKYQENEDGDWIQYSYAEVGRVVKAAYCPHITPYLKVPVPEGYELWHVAGNPPPDENLPAGAKYGSLAWGVSGRTGKSIGFLDAKINHYVIPIQKPEATILVEGKEISESTVKAALAAYVTFNDA